MKRNEGFLISISAGVMVSLIVAGVMLFFGVSFLLTAAITWLLSGMLVPLGAYVASYVISPKQGTNCEGTAHAHGQVFLEHATVHARSPATDLIK